MKSWFLLPLLFLAGLVIGVPASLAVDPAISQAAGWFGVDDGTEGGEAWLKGRNCFHWDRTQTPLLSMDLDYLVLTNLTEHDFLVGLSIDVAGVKLARGLGGETLMWVPKDAVWAFIIPIVSFVRPYRVIRDANPLPSVCARVCNHPCEAVCRCGTTGGEGG